MKLPEDLKNFHVTDWNIVLARFVEFVGSIVLLLWCVYNLLGSG